MSLQTAEMDLCKFCQDLGYVLLGQRSDQVGSVFESYNFHSNNSGLVNNLKQLVLCLCQAEYESVLQNSLAAEILGTNIREENLSLQDFNIFLNGRSLKYLQNEVDDQAQCLRQVVTMVTGIACLQLFIQCNWTGPPLTEKASEFLPSCYRSMDDESLLQMSINCLNLQGQGFYHGAQQPLFLVLASALLVTRQKELSFFKTSYVWAIRCMSIKQQLMEEHSNDTMNQTLDFINKVHDSTSLLSPEIERHICCELLLELGHLCLYYWELTKAKEYLSNAEECLGLKLSLTGALGKRTKFQEKFIAQLKVDVDRSECAARETVYPEINVSDLPKNVTLDNDTLLDTIKFKDGDSNESAAELTALEQAFVLATCSFCKKTKATDTLSTEELLAYLESLTRHPTMWTTHMLALLMRSKLEKGKTRKVERAMMQLETLVNAVRELNPKAKARHTLFYCVSLPPRWEIERELARLLLSLGAVKSALEVFERLQMWEDVITCYQTLGWHEKAEKLVRNQLELNETPTLWCLLGDITKDATFYEKAWELSNHRNSRAQRSIGLLHLRAVRYSECIPCFQKSLAINSLQEGVWFSLGCAAMATGDLELASKAFHRCVNLDSTNGEAWNNLANVSLQQNNKQKAHVALQESLRSNYDNWHVWENFLVVSMDIGAFRDVIRSYHRLMDLRDKYKDVEILGLLVKAVNEDTPDKNGTPASKLKPELLKLMGRTTSQITNDSTIWKLYSDLYVTEESPDSKEKALNFLVKAHRGFTQDPSCEKDVTKLNEAIEMTLHLSELYEEVSTSKSDKIQEIQLLSSAKLTLKQLITKAKKQHSDLLTGKISDELAGGLASLETKLQHIMDRIATLKG